MRRLFLLASLSAIVLLAGIALEGFGLRPLLIGLQIVPVYGMSANLWKPIWMSAGKIVLISSCSVFALLFWLTSIVTPKFRTVVVEPWCQMLGFTCISGFLSLVTFIFRHAPHYALISGPFLIISSAIAVVIVGRTIPQSYRKTPVFYFAVILLALLPFVRENSRSAFYAWPVQGVIKPLLPRPWHLRPGPAADLKLMKQHLQPMEYIYVLPPSQNEVHFFLNTRHSFYGWGRAVPLTEILQSRNLEGVIVMNRQTLFEYYVTYADRMFQYDRAEQILRQYQFKPVVELQTMVLWRKTSVQNYQVVHQKSSGFVNVRN